MEDPESPSLMAAKATMEVLDSHKPAKHQKKHKREVVLDTPYLVGDFVKEAEEKKKAKRAEAIDKAAHARK